MKDASAADLFAAVILTARLRHSPQPSDEIIVDLGTRAYVTAEKIIEARLAAKAPGEIPLSTTDTKEEKP